MSAPKVKSFNPNKVLSIIMGGGQGTRLFPLTQERSKPAVPLGGKYRLVDIPISNCLNSGLKKIYLLTQFNSASLHRHISQSYKFDHFGGGFVEILAAEQSFTNTSWYQGTADAVRKNLVHYKNHNFDYALILSGDQLYRMDFSKVIKQHMDSGAEVTIATMPVPRNQAQALGILQINESLQITRFVEKPKEEAVLNTLQIPHDWYERLDIEGKDDFFLASMGIYVFNREVLFKLLDNDFSDFGKHIIPGAIETHKVHSHIFQGYWEDIGTIRSFFEANLNLASDDPSFDFFDMASPIFTRPRFLPGSLIKNSMVDSAVISDGCVIHDAKLTNSIIGVRCLIDPGCVINRTIALGCDYYETPASIEANAALGRPRVGIGRNTRIENAIIDKNARIGDNCVISPAGKPENTDHPLYYIRDGILIIPKNGCIPSGTVL